MFRKILSLVLLVFVIGCKKNTLPPECVIEDFNETAYEGIDYSVIRDAIGDYNLKNYNCYEKSAFEMLQTPEKQALYEPAIMKYADILVELSASNKFVDSHPGKSHGDLIIFSRLTVQAQIDDFLRARKTPINENKVPQKCRSFATSAERNTCYEEILKEYTEQYIFEGPFYDYLGNKTFKNKKPTFTKVLNEGLSAIKALYQAASDDQAFIDDQLEAYYLELITNCDEILSDYKKSQALIGKKKSLTLSL